MTREDLIARKQQPADVPCRNCTACCERDIIALDPQRDDVASYRHHIEAGRPVLDRKPNGQCTYLAPGGCSIHDRRPDICRRFDCRVLYLLTPRDRRRVRIAQNPSMRAVYAAGRARASSLQVD